MGKSSITRASLDAFWRRFKPESPPFIHPDDLEVLEQPHAKDLHLAKRQTFRRFVRDADAFHPNSTKALHLSLLPVPYIGDLNNAKVFVLLLNPRLGFADYFIEWEAKKYRRALLRSLAQKFTSDESRFLGLASTFCWTGGFQWWEKRLRSVTVEVARSKRVSYQEALRLVGRVFAAIELLPYRSRSFNSASLTRKLPSSIAARCFVHEVLVPKARAGKLLVFVARGYELWDRPRGRRIIRNHSRGFYISAKGRTGRAILQAVGALP